MAKKRQSGNRFLNPLGLASKQFTRAFPIGRKLTWRKLGRLALLLGAALLAIFIGMVIVFSFDLPKPGQIAQYHPTSSTKIYDRNGNLLYDIFGEERRTVVDSNAIPDALKQATVSIEDHDFYHHHGVDFRAIGRAVVVDIIRHSKSQGASTITQQLVRNAIDDVGKQKSITRKIKEVILALEFEQIHSKDEILTLYLNEIPYGNNNYGIQAAAQGYFGKNASDLNPANAKDDAEKAKLYSQVAVLVSLPQAPTYYNPYGNHTDQLTKRRDTVLQKMVNQGYLAQNIADMAKTHDVEEGVTRAPESITAPHFVFYIREQLVDLLGGGQIGELRLSTEA